MQGKSRKRVRIAILAVLLTTLGMIGIGAIAASQADAASVQYANAVAHGTGATAAFANGTWTLDSGHGVGGSAQVDLVNPGTATTEPTMTTSSEAAGDPRWVIEFHNGTYLFGIPANGANSSKLAWTLEPAGTAETDYAHALAAAQAGGSDDQVTAAFIVQDTGNPDTTVNLTNVTYDGLAVVPQPAPIPYVYNGGVVSVTYNTGVVSWNESQMGWPDSKNKCEEVWISGYGFGAWNPADPTNPGTAHVGFTCEHDGSNYNQGYLRGLAKGHTYALRIVPATGVYGNNKPIPGAHVAYVDVFTTR